MGTGQTVLTIGAFMLLVTTMMTMNKGLLSHGQILWQTEVGVYAISMAASVIDEASGMSFDEKTVAESLTSTTGLTSSAFLGPETGEATTPASTRNFDDFDDYNNLNMTDTVPGVDVFRVNATVVYVSDANPNGSTTTPTWYKKMTVTVSSSVSADTVKKTFIYTYFNFR